MLQLLFLCHAALAIFLIFTRPLGTAQRARFVRFAGLAGTAASVALFFVRGAQVAWGAAILKPGSGAVVAAATACAWTLVVASDNGRGRWDVAALVGAAATGLALFSTSAWVVPAILFWVVVSLATMASARSDPSLPQVWLAVAVSDACVVAGLAVWSLGRETWRMPDALDGWLLVPLVAAVVLRTAVVPVVGIWQLTAGDRAPVLPLLIASGFALIPSVSGGDEVLVGLGLLLLALAGAAWSILRAAPQPPLVGAWICAVMVAVAWVQPAALGRAGVTAILGASLAALWPASAGRAQSERGLVIAGVPLTVGFGVIVGGAGVSFDRATVAETVLESAPWSAFAALLPVVLAAGVTLGAALAGRLEPERYRAPAVLATWAIAAAAVLLGVAPRPELGFSGAGAVATRTVWLYTVAALAALAAARFAPRQAAVLHRSEPPSPGRLGPQGAAGRALLIAAGLLGVTAVTAIAWLTYVGLRSGFL